MRSKIITVQTASGVGYNVYVFDQERYSVGLEVSLYIITIVREDALDLYGFLTAQERELCELLLSVSGVGPKTAVGIMGSTTPDMLVDALKNRNSAFISTLPGIGKKGAEKMILELSDKVKNLSFNPVNSIQNDLIEALISMGYQPRHVSEVLANHTFASDSLADKIRESLGLLRGAK